LKKHFSKSFSKNKKYIFVTCHPLGSKHVLISWWKCHFPGSRESGKACFRKPRKTSKNGVFTLILTPQKTRFFVFLRGTGLNREFTSKFLIAARPYFLGDFLVHFSKLCTSDGGLQCQGRQITTKRGGGILRNRSILRWYENRVFREIS